MLPDEAATTVEDHQLLGFDATSAICACGLATRSRATWLEHLGAISLINQEAPGTHQTSKTQDHIPDPLQLRIRALAAAPSLELTRAILRDENCYQDALRRQLDRLGLTAFLDRATWLEKQRLARLARDRRRAAAQLATEPGERLAS